MKREEALRYIKSAAGHLIVTDRKVVGMALLEAWDALRQSGWVRTADRVPEGDEHDYVVAYWCKDKRFGPATYDTVQIGWVIAHPQQYPYWLPLPPLPETVGLEGTKTEGEA